MDKRDNRIQTVAEVGPLAGRTILVLIAQVLIIPLPWAATNFYRWFFEQIRLPGGESLSFKGKAEDQWHVLMLLALLGYVGLIPIPFFAYLVMPLTAFLSLTLTRWVIANLVSDGQPLPLRFTGKYGPFLGWNFLVAISFITIIGWAWIGVMYFRWLCRHIDGTNTKVEFTGTGWEYLWRTFGFVLSAILIIPIPWTLHWYIQWLMSQFVVTKRG